VRRSQVAEERTYTVRVHNQGDEGLWAEVEELPGCFASGLDEDELAEALAEAIGLYLSTPEHRVQVQLTHGRQMESVRQERVLVS